MSEILLLAANRLSCSRDERVLFDNLSFSLSAGEIIQVVGPNGCGKTSLLRIVSGLLSVTAGDVQSCDDKIYLGHNLGLKNDFTVAENLRFDLRYQKPLISRLQAVIAETGLQQHFDTLCSKLSQGQKQRVALSKLLLSSARLWILDEPFAALDAAARGDWQQRMIDQTKKGGVVFSTHLPLDLEIPSMRIVDLTPC